MFLRLFRISKKTTEKEKLSAKCVKSFENNDELEKIRRLICRGLGLNSDELNTVRIAAPHTPKLKELVDAYCKHFDNSITPFNEVSPIQWVTTYDTNKWVGYIFGNQTLANRQNYEDIKKMIEKEWDQKFNEKATPKFY